MGEAVKLTRECDINIGKTRVKGQAFSQWQVLRCRVKVCPPVDLCFPLLTIEPLRWFKPELF